MLGITIKLEKGQKWMVTHNEIIIPTNSLSGMSAAEIGKEVLALAAISKEFQSYLNHRHKMTSFFSLEEFREEVERMSGKQVAHTPTNDSWQIGYDVYTVDDFRKMLSEDSRLQLFRPHVRKAIEALIENTESWGVVAKALGLSVHTVQDKIRNAVSEFKKRQDDSSYQPRRL